MSGFELSGPQIVELTELSAKVFDRSSFASMLLQLNFDLDRIVDTGHPERDIEDVIKKANREGWILRLIVAIKKARPNRRDVQAYCPWFNVDVVEDVLEKDNLKSILELANPSLDANAWSERLREVMSQVCRIEGWEVLWDRILGRASCRVDQLSCTPELLKLWRCSPRRTSGRVVGQVRLPRGRRTSLCVRSVGLEARLPAFQPHG